MQIRPESHSHKHKLHEAEGHDSDELGDFFSLFLGPLIALYTALSGF